MDVTIPAKSEACQDIEFLLSFLDTMSIEKLRNIDIGNAERLCRVFRIDSIPGGYDEVFTRLDAVICVNSKGEHLPCLINGKVVKNTADPCVDKSKKQYDYLCMHLIPDSMNKLRTLFESRAFAHRFETLSDEVKAILGNMYKVINDFQGKTATPTLREQVMARLTQR